MANEFNYESNLDSLNQQFKEYEEKKEQKTAKEKREEILKKIFNPREDRETFRIIPSKGGKKFYETAFFHNIQVTTTGGNKRWVKIYCPKHNDPMVPKVDKDGDPVTDGDGKPILAPAPCPLCDKHVEILSTQDQSIRYKKREELNDVQKIIFDENKNIFMDAKKYEASKFYIVKGIDRTNQSHGPKFWRFKDSFTNRGTMDKLKTELEEYIQEKGKDFMSPIDGTDLRILMSNAKTPAGKTYRDISAIKAVGPSPLHEESHIAKSWLNDDSTWRDAFKPRKAPNITTHQYLEMLAEGKDPYYDEVDKKWYFPGNPELEELANTKDRNLDTQKTQEKASDLDDGVKIDNIKEEDVGEFEDDSVDVSSEFKKEETKKDNVDKSIEEDDLFGDDDDDLPF